LRRKGRSIGQAIEALTTRLDRVPSEEEIASEMGISLTDYHHLLGDLRGLEIGSLHFERGEDSGEEELASRVPQKTIRCFSACAARCGSGLLQLLTTFPNVNGGC
jgi:DNA-directed RNA polymerase specialized sigma subunit